MTGTSPVVDTDKRRLDVDMIYHYLRESYWAKNIPRALLERSIENSFCFGVYVGDRQAGFARVITDYATFAYVSDVFVLEEFRGQGLSKLLMETMLNHPELQGLRRWCLATRDAHGLYAQYRFTPLVKPEAFMERYTVNAYGA
jgi:GNAT superfamily N-acetyltransferase